MVARDERARSQQLKARASESAAWDAQRLNVALSAARLGDWSWNAATDEVVMSPRAAEIFGLATERRVTWTELRELLHRDDRESARLAVERAASERSDYRVEYRVIHDGRERWVAASGRGVYSERGEVLGMVGVVQDLTRDRILVRVDDALRPLVAPGDITYTAARALGEYLEVHRCAYAFVEDDEDSFTLTGNYTHGVGSIVGRYRFRQFGAECLRLMRAGEPYVVSDSEHDPRIDAEDRKAYRLTAIRAVICVPVAKQGRFVAAMAVHMSQPRSWSSIEVELVQQVASRCWESIERARVEQERAALLEAAQAANRAKDEFLAMLGHELRNPLAPIVTALHLMKLRGDSSFARERTVIERQVSHLSRLVDDLLDVSRIARGKVELRHEPVDLADVVKQAVEVASPLFEQGRHQLEVSVPAAQLVVSGDRVRLVQVVANLLTNAAKYTSPGGHVSITAEADGGEAVLRVRDDGIGIAAEVLPQVFDLFVQGPQASDRARGGLGLGLSIVRGIVAGHAGRVVAHSDGPGRGSEFVVHLPLASEPPRAVSSSSAPESGKALTKPLEVLVVDDNVDAAELLAEALAACGCRVVTAHDGPEALRLAARSEFDAALLDIGLPVMDGYELVGRLRELPGLSRARFVAVTGYGQESDRRRASEAGFDEHFVKPVDLARITAMLATLRDTRRARSR
jgi:PAS domain S-box-containing protein